MLNVLTLVLLLFHHVQKSLFQLIILIFRFIEIIISLFIQSHPLPRKFLYAD